MVKSTITGWWYTYPSEKNMSSSVGMMKFPTEWTVIKFMFQTTNQIVFAAENSGGFLDFTNFER